MTTNRPEFTAHDDFIFEHKKIGKVTREEFIKYIRSSLEHMRQLSELIQQYNQTFDDYLDEWDGRFESFDDDVKDLLHLWIQDGTMDHIINENLMSTKADKTYVDDLNENLTAQLAHKATKGDITLSDLNKNKVQFDETWISDSLKQQMAGNTPVTSLPVDESVTTKKIADKAVTENKLSTEITRVDNSNVLDETEIIEEGYFPRTTGVWTDNKSYASSGLIPCQPNDVVRVTETLGNQITYWSEEAVFISGVDRTTRNYFTVPDNANIAFFRLNIPTSSLGDEMMVVINRELPDRYIAYNQQILNIKDENIENGSLTLEKLSANLTKTSHINLLDESKAELGGYYARATGEWIPTTSHRATPLIDCKPNERFTTLNVGNHVTFWDENDVYVFGLDNSPRDYFIVPDDENITGLRINIRSQTSPKETMVVRGDELPSSYVAYKEKIFNVRSESLEDGSIEREKLSKKLDSEIFSSDYLKPFNRVENPVITPDIVTDRLGVRSVADPFIVMDKGRYHMFFETIGGLRPGYDVSTEEIAHAYSDDLINWTYTQIVIGRNEHGHRSAYPHVFKVDGEWYMLPDTGGRIKLYKATNFPLEWEFQLDLVETSHVDTNIFKIGDIWYMTTYKIGDGDGVRLYYNNSDDWKNTNWITHPKSPIVPHTENRRQAKGAGNPRVFEDYVLLPFQVKYVDDAGLKTTYLYKLGDFSPETVTVTELGVWTKPQYDGSWMNTEAHHVSHAEYINGHIYAADGIGPTGYTIGLFMDNL